MVALAWPALSAMILAVHAVGHEQGTADVSQLVNLGYVESCRCHAALELTEKDSTRYRNFRFF
jgi:hypothetical protein